MRQKVVTGNWKMHKTIEEACSFVQELIPHVQNSPCRIYLAVPYTMIYPLAQEFGDSSITFGAQNMNDASEGAFTGEIAAKMLLDAGAKFVLLGHSERRYLFNESNAFINRKVKRAVHDGLQPVLCIGETKLEHADQQTEEVLRTQITEGLLDLDENELLNLMIAYEPVWAIGTGHTPTPEKVSELHQFCRGVLAELFSAEFAEKIIIQYGGSVTPAIAKSLLFEQDIDGLLIGGASLSLESFSQIVNDSQLNQSSKG